MNFLVVSWSMVWCVISLTQFFQFGLGRQFAEQKQIGHLEEAAILGQLLRWGSRDSAECPCRRR